MSDATTVIYDAGEVATAIPAPDKSVEIVGDAAASGPAGVVDEGGVAIVDGEIALVGESDAVTREYPPENATRVIDASGRAVMPGYVDAHTHALFAGDRSDEFAAKCRGVTYQTLLEEGGGIHRTVRATRAASDETLLTNLLAHLDVMLAHGTTTVEVKSGYGLETETELGLLDVMARADRRHPVDVVPTFMGAHAVPRDEEAADPAADAADAYVEAVIESQLPAVAEQGIAEFCDVFCESGVFSVDQSRRVLEAGLAHGLTPKVHAEELSRLGGAQLAAEVGAASADHLLHATEADIDALLAADVVPVVLPGTAFGMGAEYADARRMWDAGAPVAVATDFNPNCHSQSVGFATALACVEMGLSPAEALVGATNHGARAIDRAPRGRIQPGAPADLVVLDAPSHVHVPYSYGVNRVATVLKGGEVVATDGRPLDRSGPSTTTEAATGGDQHG